MTSWSLYCTSSLDLDTIVNTKIKLKIICDLKQAIILFLIEMTFFGCWPLNDSSLSLLNKQSNRFCLLHYLSFFFFSITLTWIKVLSLRQTDNKYCTFLCTVKTVFYYILLTLNSFLAFNFSDKICQAYLIIKIHSIKTNKNCNFFLHSKYWSLAFSLNPRATAALARKKCLI
jgi:hypothetical protein